MKRKGDRSNQPKPKKNKVDHRQQSLLSFYPPLRGNRREVQQEVLGNDDEDHRKQSLLSFYPPLRGNRREVQQEVLGNDDDDENTDDDVDMVQQDEGVNGTQEEAERTPFRTASSNRDRSPPRKRKAKRRRKRSSCLRDEASDDDDDDDDDDEEEHDSDREFLAPDDDVEEDVGVFGASRAQYVICPG